MTEPDSNIGDPGSGERWDDKELPSCSTWPDVSREETSASTPPHGVWGIGVLLLYVAICLVWPEIPTTFLALLTALSFVGALDKSRSSSASSQTTGANQLSKSTSCGAQTERDTNDADALLPVHHNVKRKVALWSRRVEGDDLGLPNPNPGDDFMGRHLSTNHYKAELSCTNQSSGANRSEHCRGIFDKEKKLTLRKNFSKNCSQEISTIRADDTKDLIDLSSHEDLVKLNNSAARTDLVEQKDTPLLSSVTKRILEQRQKSPTKGSSYIVTKRKISPKSSSSRLKSSLSETQPARGTRLDVPVFAKVWRDPEPVVKPPWLEGDDLQVNHTVKENTEKETSRESKSSTGTTDDEVLSQHLGASDSDIILLLTDDESQVSDLECEELETATDWDKDHPVEAFFDDGMMMTNVADVDRNLNCHECPEGTTECHKKSDFLTEPIAEWLGNMRLSNTKKNSCLDKNIPQTDRAYAMAPENDTMNSDMERSGLSDCEDISHKDSGFVETPVCHCRMKFRSATSQAVGITPQTTEGQTQTLQFADILRINVQRQLQVEKRRFRKRRNRLKLKYSRELMKLQRDLLGKNKILSSLQLKIPNLEGEVRRLEANNRELVFDLDQERTKSQDLMCRLSTVYEKLMVISTTQQQQQQIMLQQQHLQQQQQF